MKLSLLRLTNTGDYARAASRSPPTSSGLWACCASTPSTRCRPGSSPSCGAIFARNRFDPAVRGTGRVLRAERAADGATPPTGASSSAATARVENPAGLGGGALGRGRRGARSMRRAAVRAEPRARREREVAVLLGAAEGREAALALVERYRRRAKARGCGDRRQRRALARAAVGRHRAHAGAERSTPWSTAGRCTRRSPAGCGRARRSTRAAAPTASATSCRT